MKLRNYLKPITAALAGLALMVVGALAVTPYDSTRNLLVRQFSTQQVAYYRFVVNFNDPQIGSTNGQSIGKIPKNAYIQDVQVEVVTAFNAVTTNLLTVGTTSANINELVASGDLTGNNTSSLGTQVTKVNRGLGRSLTAAADTTIFVKYAQTGTAATQGQAVVIVTFIQDNDQ